MIGYIGNNMPCVFLDKSIYWLGKDLIKIEADTIIGKYKILIIEVSDNMVDFVLKWIFTVFCKKEIPVIVVAVELSSKNKLRLCQLGIEEYIEFGSDEEELHHKINNIQRKMRWKSNELI